MKQGVMTIGTMVLLAINGARAEFPWEGQRVQVESSVFDTAAYHEGKHELTLWFDNGAVYVYREVPSSLYLQFLESPHKGLFFNKHIKGRFASECRQMALRKPVSGHPAGSAPSPSDCLRVASGGAS